jgi:hypothetical protein
MELDDRGIPIFDDSLNAAPECPPNPCQLCSSGSPVNWSGTNFEWCQQMKTCAATIDWEKIFSA